MRWVDRILARSILRGCFGRWRHGLLELVQAFFDLLHVPQFSAGCVGRHRRSIDGCLAPIDQFFRHGELQYLLVPVLKQRSYTISKVVKCSLWYLHPKRQPLNFDVTLQVTVPLNRFCSSSTVFVKGEFQKQVRWMCCRATARVHPKNGLHIEDPFVHRLTDDSHQVAFINLSIQRPPLRANLIPWWSRKTTLRPLPSLPCTASIRLVSLCQRSAVSTKPIYCRICLITGRPLFLPRFAKQQTLRTGGAPFGLSSDLTVCLGATVCRPKSSASIVTHRASQVAAKARCPAISCSRLCFMPRNPQFLSNFC